MAFVNPQKLSHREVARMRRVIVDSYGAAAAPPNHQDLAGACRPDTEGGSASLVGTGSGGGKKRRDTADSVEDEVLAIVQRKEVELKEDPEFKFRKKPQPRANRLVGNAAITKSKEEPKKAEPRKASKYLIKGH